MSKEDASLTKGTIAGDVNFPPFEEALSDEVLQEIHKYQVTSLGQIRASPKHIPYNSEKKNFWERTGRDSLEVFQYTFQRAGDKDPFTVMWDYNIGLVRITPFFKCCNYSKTMPARMLNTNKGLKDITHSITGGSLSAQGYWMPYECAKAVCATFCHGLAGALIPIFGPDFPSACVPNPDLENISWQIKPEIIKIATQTAEAFRIQYSIGSTNSTASASASPSHLLGSLALGSPLCNQQRSDRPFTDSDNEVSDTSNSSLDLQGASPATPEDMPYPSNRANHHGWTPTQTTYKLPDPSLGTASRPKRYWTEMTRNRPARTREADRAISPSYLEGISNVSDDRPASPWLSALPGLTSINADKATLITDRTRLGKSGQTFKKQFVAANANAKAHIHSRSVSNCISEVRGYCNPSTTKHLEPHRSIRRGFFEPPTRDEDDESNEEIDTSPGPCGDESRYTSLDGCINNTNHGSGGACADYGKSNHHSIATMMHTSEEKEAAMALVQLSVDASGSSEREARSSTNTSIEARDSGGMSNERAEPTKSSYGNDNSSDSSSGPVDGGNEMEADDTETDDENAGAKRRRIRSL